MPPHWLGTLWTDLIAFWRPYEAERAARLEQVVRYQEVQIVALEADKEALRRSMQHWRGLYNELAHVIPEEREG